MLATGPAIDLLYLVDTSVQYEVACVSPEQAAADRQTKAAADLQE